jgi:manganese transport protein
MTWKKRIMSVLFWSIVSAAFIGPGTVTTATKAGVHYNFQLLWTLVFSTFATLMLQEASARLAITTKMNLGEAIAKQFEGKRSRFFALFIIIVAIVLGCAAYEAGNILGAVAGLGLIFDIPTYYFVGAIGIMAILVFSLRSVHAIARFMGVIVFLMGIAFFTTSIMLRPDWSEVLRGSTIPSIPSGSGAGLLILGLIGTTVIPYDLFLGSGVSDKNQSLQEMRFGLSVAIILGGIISMSIMGVGNAITEGMSETARLNMEFSYDLLKNTLELTTGKFAIYIFGFGMFAAGFSSAVTSPLASAITAKSLFANKRNSHLWKDRAAYFRLVIIGVLSIGLLFGFLQVKPIPAIIVAQAFNGLILPLIAAFLIYVINDVKIMGYEGLNGWVSNIFMTIIMWVSIVLGFTNIAKAFTGMLDIDIEAADTAFIVPVMAAAFIFTIIIILPIFRRRRKLLLENKKLKNSEQEPKV